MRRLICAAAAAALLCSCSGKKEEAVPAPPLKRAVETLYAKQPCASVIPSHWSPSWPVPSSAKAGEFRLMFYPVERKGKSLALSAPLGQATFTADGTPSSCTRMTGEPAELPGPMKSQAAQGLGAAQVQAYSDRLYALSEEAGKAYWSGKAPDEGQRALLEEYVRLFKTLAEPPLLPYYYELDPAFWDWLNSAGVPSLSARK